MHIFLLSVVLLLVACVIRTHASFLFRAQKFSPKGKNSNQPSSQLFQSARSTPNSGVSKKVEARSSKTTVCKFCNSSFNSRNQFFRHVRTDPKCSVLAMNQMISKNTNTPQDSDMKNIIEMNQKILQEKVNMTKALYERAPKRTCALQIGYYFDDETVSSSSRVKNSNSNNNELIMTSSSELAGRWVKNAFVQTLLRDMTARTNYYPASSCISKNEEKELLYNWINEDLIGFTQTSATSLRPRVLKQESYVGSTGDVIVLNYRHPDTNHFDELLADVNVLLKEAFKNSKSMVKVLSAESKKVDDRLHAEGSCTQITYHFLVPLEWLPGHNAPMELSFHEQSKPDTAGTPAVIENDRRRNGVEYGEHFPRKKLDTPPTIKELKRIF